MTYRKNKHFGNKSGQFKTVLGYIPESKPRRLVDLSTHKTFLLENNVYSLPLLYALLYLHKGQKVWKILRILKV
nr:MAG TPA: hypothetical protein [Caudoviricetes sp.]